MIEPTPRERIRTFMRVLTPRKGSISHTARKIGYFIMFYVLIMAGVVIIFAVAGISALAIPLIAVIPAMFFANRLAQAANTAAGPRRE